MALFRPIYKTIWRDPDFQELSSNQKLLFLYFCTNESTNESGIFQLTPRTISNETAIPYETVLELLSNCSIKNIVYDMDNKVVYVRKIRKYSTGGNPDLIRKAIANEYRLLRKSKLWDLFFQDYPVFQGLYNSSQTDIEGFYNNNYNNTNNNNLKEGDTKGENKKKKSDNENFETFWSAYPRKIAKVKALQSFNRINPDDALFKTIIEKLELYKQSREWKDSQFIPHPTTWLNQRRWEDDISVSGNGHKPEQEIPQGKYSHMVKRR